MKLDDNELDNLLDTKTIDELIESLIDLAEMMDDDVRKKLLFKLITELRDLEEIDNGIRKEYRQMNACPYDGYDKKLKKMMKKILKNYGN